MPLLVELKYHKFFIGTVQYSYPIWGFWSTAVILSYEVNELLLLLKSTIEF